MKSWSGGWCSRDSEVIGYLVLFGFVRGPKVEGKEVVPQLQGKDYSYYFPNYTVMESIWGRMEIWRATTRVLRRVLR